MTRIRSRRRSRSRSRSRRLAAWSAMRWRDKSVCHATHSVSDSEDDESDDESEGVRNVSMLMRRAGVYAFDEDEEGILDKRGSASSSSSFPMNGLLDAAADAAFIAAAFIVETCDASLILFGSITFPSSSSSPTSLSSRCPLAPAGPTKLFLTLLLPSSSHLQRLLNTLLRCSISSNSLPQPWSAKSNARPSSRIPGRPARCTSSVRHSGYGSAGFASGRGLGRCGWIEVRTGGWGRAAVWYMSSSSSLSSVSSSFDRVLFSSAGLVEGFSCAGFCVGAAPAVDRGFSSTTSGTKVDDMGGGKCRWSKRKILLNAK